MKNLDKRHLSDYFCVNLKSSLISSLLVSKKYYFLNPIAERKYFVLFIYYR